MMTLFTEFERDPDAEIGVRFSDFITAVGIYVYTNESSRPVTIADVAMTFNTSVEDAREAVKVHPWLFSLHHADPAQQTIESDGE